MELLWKNKIDDDFIVRSLCCATILHSIFSGTVYCAADDSDKSNNEVQKLGAIDCLRFSNPWIECRAMNVTSGECTANPVQILSIPNNPENNENGKIICNSRSPIDISFVGYRLDDYVKTSFVRGASSDGESFSISLSLSGVRATREVIISIINIPTENVSFFLFRPGSTLFSTNFETELNPDYGIPIPHTERFHLQLPCIPNDPNVELTLLDAVEWSMLDTKGFPHSGFNIEIDDDDPSGQYICEALDTRAQPYQREFLHFEVQKKEEKVCEPPNSKVYLFLNSAKKISCKYKDDITLEATLNGDNVSPISIVSPNSTLPYEKYLTVRGWDEGKIQCKSGAKEVCSWDVEAIDIYDYDNQVLQLHTLPENKIMCLSNTFKNSEIRLQLLSCQGVRECQLNEFCFEDREVKRQGQRASACSKTVHYGSFCDSNKNSMCLTLPQDSSNELSSQGMIRCSAGPHFYQSNYFVGFDNVLHLDLKTAPYASLIQIISVNESLEMGKSYPFVCKASKFISDGLIQWAILTKNGSMIYLGKDVEDLREVHATKLDYKLYTVRESVIRLDHPNEFDLICRVPLWNSGEWATLKKRIIYEKGLGSTEPTAVTEVIEQDLEASITIGIIVGSCVALLFVLGLIIFILWKIKKYKRENFHAFTTPLATPKENIHMSMTNDADVIDTLNDALQPDVYEIVESLPYNKEFLIPRDKLFLDFDKILGKGQFGTVYRGSVEGVSGTVAVKTINTDSELHRKGFLRELKVMIHIGEHPNIIKLIGASTEGVQDNTLYIVLEFCEKGNLESHLRSCKSSFVNQIVDDEIKPGISQLEPFPSYAMAATLEPNNMVTTTDLLRWSYQIANGMEFLASKRVIHSDLAARNILVDGKDDVKITDFGLSRRLYDLTEYVKKQQEPLPWRWMAVESLRELKFTSQSDVWSFGILLWEIFSLGSVPYPGLVWRADFAQQLENGLRMSQPSYSNSEIYNLMLNCWEDNPEQRPSFGELGRDFNRMLMLANLDSSELEEEVQDSLKDYTQVPTYTTVNILSSRALR